MLNCKQASQLVSQSLDRPLSGRERVALRFHLLMCRFCKRFSSQMQLIRLSIARMISNTEQDEQLKLTPQARQRISEAIESKPD